MAKKNSSISVDPQDQGSKWPARHSALARSFEIFCKSVFKTYCPLSVFGKENLPQPPFLICSNHASHMDSTMLMVASGIPFQRTGLIAAKDYFFDQGKWFFVHHMLNLVPIARGSGSQAIRESLVECRSFIEHGGLSLIIFPEGTRSKTGRIESFKQGAAIIAHEMDIPVVPACVKGSRKALPKGGYFIRPHRLEVHFGKPFRVSEWVNQDVTNDRSSIFHAYRVATAKIEHQVRQMAKKKEAKNV